MLPECTNYVVARPVSALINNTAVRSRLPCAVQGEPLAAGCGEPAAPRSSALSPRKGQGAHPVVGSESAACQRGGHAMGSGTGWLLRLGRDRGAPGQEVGGALGLGMHWQLLGRESRDWGARNRQRVAAGRQEVAGNRQRVALGNQVALGKREVARSRQEVAPGRQEVARCRQELARNRQWVAPGRQGVVGEQAEGGTGQPGGTGKAKAGTEPPRSGTRRAGGGAEQAGAATAQEGVAPAGRSLPSHPLGYFRDRSPTSAAARAPPACGAGRGGTCPRGRDQGQGRGRGGGRGAAGPVRAGDGPCRPWRPLRGGCRRSR